MLQLIAKILKIDVEDAPPRRRVTCAADGSSGASNSSGTRNTKLAKTGTGTGSTEQSNDGSSSEGGSTGYSEVHHELMQINASIETHRATMREQRSALVD